IDNLSQLNTPLAEYHLFAVFSRHLPGSGHLKPTNGGAECEYLAWEVRSPGWWGEGEIKFFMDGDKEFPTICGTGTEDYFCGSYNFENQLTKKYQTFSTPYTGLAQVLPPDIAYKPGQRFGLYRWHIADPIRFKDDLKVTIQALGWQSGGRYLPLEDDIASVAYWYQAEPHAKFPALPGKEQLIVGPLKVEASKAP
ncbi:MAG: glycoside hydrolase family 172 protein, partial [Tepidisphaeraceae bacterium]